MRRKGNVAEPGDVLVLHREIDGIQPGAFLLLHVEDASAMLCRLDGQMDENVLGEPSLVVTNIYDLSLFAQTSVQYPLEDGRESLQT